MFPVARKPVVPARLSSCLLLALFPALAYADAPDANVITLETVVVTAAAPLSPLQWVTDPRLPRQPVPASDGADYLKTVPGFSAIRNGGTNGDPVLRGMSGSRLNILTNDGNMMGACPSRMDNPLSYVAPETFDRLTVIKGPQSVRWGAGASAGTVRFERDTPRFSEPGMELQASALAGSNGRNDQVLDASVGSTPGYVRVNGNRSESGDYRDGNGDVVPSRWRKWNADATIGWTPDSLEQRNGRGVRQGNKTQRVSLYYYDADGTFDTSKRAMVNKKADWIGQVMDVNGSDSVAVTGGLSKEQMEALIDVVGDADAMRRMQETIAAKEAASRASSNRDRQMINLDTIRKQNAFLNDNQTAASFVIRKIIGLWGLEKQAEKLRDRISNPKATATAVATGRVGV